MDPVSTLLNGFIITVIPSERESPWKRSRLAYSAPAELFGPWQNGGNIQTKKEVLTEVTGVEHRTDSLLSLLYGMEVEFPCFVRDYVGTNKRGVGLLTQPAGR